MISFYRLLGMSAAVTAAFATAAGAVRAAAPSDRRTDAMTDRQSLANDPQRTTYHFQAPKGWLNDPNGLIQFHGDYHMFYQFFPEANPTGDMKLWAHAVSRDLVHWKDLPIALKADTPSDKDGVWSGCAVDDNGTPTAVYTGVDPQVQCIAVSKDKDLITWEKPDVNPVIAAPPPGMEVVGFRDPFVWREGDHWSAVVGTGIKHIGPAVLLYHSKDLRRWDYQHPLLVGDASKTGDMWECPNYFPLGDKWVLMVSTLGMSYHMVGTYKDEVLAPESEGSTDLGGALYAPQTFQDDQGRRILFGWLWEQREHADKYGWQGAMSLPRVITLGADNTLRYAPAVEVDKLRDKKASFQSVAVTPGGSGFLPGISGAALEIDAEINVGDASRTGLVVRRSPDGTEQTRIYFDAKSEKLFVDRSHSSTDATAEKNEHWTMLHLAAGEPLKLRVYVDHSVLEIFANGRECLTCRIYPSRPDSLGVDAFAEGGTASISKLEPWTMKPIWPDGGK